MKIYVFVEPLVQSEPFFGNQQKMNSCLDCTDVTYCEGRGIRTPIKILPYPFTGKHIHTQTHPSAYLHFLLVLSDDQRISSSSSSSSEPVSRSSSGSPWSDYSDGPFTDNTINSIITRSSHHDSEPFFPETATATDRCELSSHSESQVPYVCVLREDHDF